MATAPAPADRATPAPVADEPASHRDRTRARHPDTEGYAERDGVRLWYEVYGHGEPTTVLVPTWQIIHSRLWKAQIPYLARHGRVVTFDPRGNGRSDRPSTSEGFVVREMAADILTVMDATATDRAILVTLSAGTARALVVAAEHPERVAGLVAIAPSLAIGERLGERGYPFDEALDTDDGWAKDNIHYWRRDFEGYLQFFFSRCFTEAHSTKQIEDCVGWGLEIGAETLALGEYTRGLSGDEVLALAARVGCPVLVLVGDRDAITGMGPGVAFSEAVPDGRLVVINGAGHVPDARDPVLVNLLIRDFVRRLGSRT
ncbi:MAG: alpha/beta fold hydrolase [Candidatus Limnocylindrales bacterium]